MMKLLLAFALSPTFSAYLASWIVEEPSLAPRLIRICTAESRCSIIGIHQCDAHKGKAAWRNAVRVGSLRPETCLWHQRWSPARWSTRGPFGTMAAYTMKYLGGCFPPEVLDIPLVAAVAAAKRIQGTRGRRHPALSRWASR